MLTTLAQRHPGYTVFPHTQIHQSKECELFRAQRHPGHTVLTHSEEELLQTVVDVTCCHAPESVAHEEIRFALDARTNPILYIQTVSRDVAARQKASHTSCVSRINSLWKLELLIPHAHSPLAACCGISRPLTRHSRMEIYSPFGHLARMMLF